VRLRPPRLDRIVRGRAWIPVLGALLVAIVGLRVEVLKLGSGVGTQVQQATLLESDNSVLRSQISALSDSQRILKLAKSYGMDMPSPLNVHIVQATAGNHVGAAMRNISASSRTTFLGGLVAEQQANGSTQSTSALTTTAVATGTSSTTGTSTAGTGLSSGTASGTPANGTTGSPTSTSGTGGLNSSGTTSSTTGATASTLNTSASTTDATSGSTAGGTGALNTGGADTTGTADSSQTAGSSTGSTTGGTGLAG
jgi:cell division protein FtsL